MMELGFYNKLGKQKPYITSRRNFSIFGQSQTGKTSLLTNLALKDIYAGKNITVIGDDLTEETLKYIPRDRQEDVVYFNPSLQPFGFNPLYDVPKEQFYARADAMVHTIHTLLTYEGSTPVMDDYIRLTILTLLHISTASSSLLSVYYFLTDDEYRYDRLEALHEPSLKKYWERFNSQSNKEKRDEVKSTLTKLSPYVFNPMLRNCFLQCANHLDFNNKIVLISLDQFAIGSSGSSFLGALILATLQSERGVHTTLYVDDADRYGGRIFGELLLNPDIYTFIACRSPHDFKKDLNSILKSSDVICFRVTEDDTRTLKNVFKIGPNAIQLYENQNYRAYILNDFQPLRLYFNEHMFQRPPRNTRRGHKRVEQSIKDRCWKLYTEPQELIQKRLGRFFSG